jgi:hypothetical protein
MRSLVVAMAMALAAATATGALYGHRRRIVRRVCFDGSGPPCGTVCPQATCDVDQTCNGICSFAFQVCGTVGCTEHLVTLPVGHRKRMTFVPSMGATPTHYALRCRHHRRRLPCPVPASPAGAFLSPAASYR